MAETAEQSRKKVTALMRRNIVLELKMAGGGDRAIQEQLASQGINVSHTTVNKDWHAALEEINGIQKKALINKRLMMDFQLNRLLLSQWSNAIGQGDGPTAKPGEVLAAEFCRKVIKDIRDLWGIDRALGTEENPQTVNLSITDEDLRGLSDDELITIERVLTRVVDRTGGLRALPSGESPN